ncbi:hypothetical protein ACF0H5_015975 [Mactra antiquata]
MDAYSLHLCFQVKGNPIIDRDVWNILQDIPSDLINSKQTPVLVGVTDDNKILITTASDGSHCLMHLYSHGLVTIDIQYDSKPLPAYHSVRIKEYGRCKGIETKIQKLLGDKCLFTRR